LQMLGAFAEFETNLRKERQLEGIAKAKARQVPRRPPSEHRCGQDRGASARGPGRYRDRAPAWHRARVGLSAEHERGGFGPMTGRPAPAAS
jgi:hypothetical protein